MEEQSEPMAHETPTVMDPEAFKTAVKVYAQNVIVTTTPEDATLQFCVRQELQDENGNPITVLMPQAVIYLTTPHLRRLASIINNQVEQLDSRLNEFAKQIGFPSKEQFEELAKEKFGQ